MVWIMTRRAAVIDDGGLGFTWFVPQLDVSKRFRRGTHDVESRLDRRHE